MNKDFFRILKESKRNIVIHNISENCCIKKFLKTNDLLFFDDCTYDQYKFIKNNLNYLNDNELNCVLGFSTNIYRKENEQPLENVKTEILHDLILNKNDRSVSRGFISYSELKDILQYDNVFLALHGHNHFNPEYMSTINSMILFKNELMKSLNVLKELNITTNIFVYPFDFIIKGTEKLLQSSGFKHIFPSSSNKRTYIERFLRGNNETT